MTQMFYPDQVRNENRDISGHFRASFLRCYKEITANTTVAEKDIIALLKKQRLIPNADDLQYEAKALVCALLLFTKNQDWRHYIQALQAYELLFDSFVRRDRQNLFELFSEGAPSWVLRF